MTILHHTINLHRSNYLRMNQSTYPSIYLERERERWLPEYVPATIKPRDRRQETVLEKGIPVSGADGGGSIGTLPPLLHLHKVLHLHLPSPPTPSHLSLSIYIQIYTKYNKSKPDINAPHNQIPRRNQSNARSNNLKPRRRWIDREIALRVFFFSFYFLISWP